MVVVFDVLKAISECDGANEGGEQSVRFRGVIMPLRREIRNTGAKSGRGRVTCTRAGRADSIKGGRLKNI